MRTSIASLSHRSLLEKEGATCASQKTLRVMIAPWASSLSEVNDRLLLLLPIRLFWLYKLYHRFVLLYDILEEKNGEPEKSLIHKVEMYTSLRE